METPADVPEVTTERLRLRGWREGDADALAVIYADPEVTRYLRRLDLDGTRQQLLNFAYHWEERGFGLWAVELRGRPELIGRIGLMHHDDWIASPHDAEVGWAMARGVWGQGLATEGGAATLRFGFQRRGMQRIISIAHRDNDASRRIMQKLGMAFGGETVWRGSPVIWHVITSDEWTAATRVFPN
jgi:RimJ/RimL family protein N-acetyltransferase